ncbi:MAG TPA: class II aldolase/adducin family protein [Burkholderiaceae bacterium]|nr:class II aldolase/adducin family protein [Burkholderiaceae bacterium]
MSAFESTIPMRPADVSDEEWRLRLQLAACYRLFDFLGWTEMIFNHITLRAPGGSADNPHYLINPFGLHYTEVTASNLVKIDRQGNKIDGSPYPVNPAGFVIHSAVHAARHDAHCVMHTHTTAGIAVACKEQGLRHDNFYSAQLHGGVAYHEFEGVTTDPAECPRLVASLGDKQVMILRNHGLLVTGQDVPDAFQRLWTLQRACEVQLAADCLAGPTRPIAPAVLARIPDQCKPVALGTQPGHMMFEGILRRAGIRYGDLV